MIKRFTLLLAIAIAAAALVAGCGDDEASGGEDTAITTSSLSKAQYVKKVDEVCAEVAQRVQKKAQAFFNKDRSGPKAFAKAIEIVFIPEIEARDDQIANLGAPAGEEAQVEAILAATQQDIDEAKELREKNFETVGPLFSQSDNLARSYGLDNCASF